MNTNDNDTDAERRALAHEQILQALIAHMVETEPRFLERLSATFSNPVRLTTSARDHKDTATYAALFVREIVRLGEVHNAPQASSRVALWDDLWPTSGEDNLRRENVPVRFDVRPRDDLWEVLRDGRLIGGYVSRAGALEAAQRAVHAIFCVGGSAELRATVS